MAIIWRPEFAIDDGAIDNDHKRLISLVNLYGTASREGATADQLTRILQELTDYAAGHFSREEDLQRAICYPLLSQHQLEHGELVRRLQRLGQRLGCRSVRTAIAGVEIGRLLRDWLLVHVVESDLRLRPYVLAFNAAQCRPPTPPDVEHPSDG